MMMEDEYLTLAELCARIKYARQTIYNLIHEKKLIIGKHYLKPTPKKILFKWSAIKDWMETIPEIPINQPQKTKVVKINSNKFVNI
jgi:hypothetical protein